MRKTVGAKMCLGNDVCVCVCVYVCVEGGGICSLR